MTWPTEKLGSLVTIKTGRLDANAADVDGLYPFFTCSREPLKINSHAFDCDAILIAGNGDLNVKHYNGKFNAYQRTYVVTSLSDKVLDTRYLFYFMDKYVERLRELSIGGVIKYIKLGMLTDAEIPLPPLAEQQRIAAILDKADAIRRKRQQAIQLADDFLRAVFLDMFGDPVTNPKGWEVKPIERLVENNKYSIKAGPFGSALKKEDYTANGYKIYGQEQVIRDDLTYGDYFISQEKYESLESCSIAEGDMLISLVGSFGKVAVVPKNFHQGIINPRLMKVTFDKSIANPWFMKFLLTTNEMIRKIEGMSHGGTMGILNVGKVRNLEVITPPLSFQMKFLKFVDCVDLLKGRFEGEDCFQLFKALSQKAFRGEL